VAPGSAQVDTTAHMTRTRRARGPVGPAATRGGPAAHRLGRTRLSITARTTTDSIHEGPGDPPPHDGDPQRGTDTTTTRVGRQPVHPRHEGDPQRGTDTTTTRVGRQPVHPRRHRAPQGLSKGRKEGKQCQWQPSCHWHLASKAVILLRSVAEPRPLGGSCGGSREANPSWDQSEPKKLDSDSLATVPLWPLGPQRHPGRSLRRAGPNVPGRALADQWDSTINGIPLVSCRCISRDSYQTTQCWWCGRTSCQCRGARGLPQPNRRSRLSEAAKRGDDAQSAPVPSCALEPLGTGNSGHRMPWRSHP